MSIPRPPFIIGITGNMDPAGYDSACTDPAREDAAIEAIRSRIHSVLLWAKSADGYLDPETGVFHDTLPGHEIHPSWLALGLKNTPIHVLTSLAPGVDTIAAEAALDFATAHPNAGIFVRAPLPFPLGPAPHDHYRHASTFGGDPGKLARLDALRVRLGKQDGFMDSRDLFDVALDEGLDGDPKVDLTALDKTFQRPRRYLRYRAAGEFIATHSDLLIAVHDKEFDKPKPDDIFEAGTIAVIEAKRQGLAYELLAATNNFSWADNGPVLRIPIRREKNSGAAPMAGGAGRMEFLHPYDLRPEPPPLPPPPPPPADNDPQWQANGDRVFRRILSYQEELNRLAEHKKEPAEHKAMLQYQDPDGGRVPVDPAAAAFAAPLAGLAAVRRRAAEEAGAADERRKSLHLLLVILIFCTALAMGMFEHWHRAGTHIGHSTDEPLWITHDFMSIVQSLLVLAALGCLLVSAWCYFRYLVSEDERRRHDYRAVSEGLRVQYYWCLTGTGCAVSAEYMQRQRNELDWIRYVISSLTFPFESWRRGFLALPEASRHQLLTSAHRNWIRAQRKYYEKNARVLYKKAHVAHVRGWTCGAAALISAIFLFMAEVSPVVQHALQAQPFIFSLGLLVAGAGVWYLRPDPGHPAEDDDGRTDAPKGGYFSAWLLSRPAIWGPGLILSAGVIGLPHLLHRFTTQWPDWHNWWIILTGGILLLGGLCLVWSERQLHSETSRQYRAMRELFACADRRMDRLLARLHGMPVTDPAYPRLLDEIHDLIHQLGCEALDEHAEWLILHRARPLEPFMAP